MARASTSAARRSAVRKDAPAAPAGIGTSVAASAKPAAVHRFTRLARGAAQLSGRPGAFLFALVFVLLWAVSGPFFGWSDTWQLVINTSTTILTFLMIFLLQNSQNRDAAAVQLKLDELIRAVDKARNSMVAAEELEDDERAELQEKFKELAEQGRRDEGKDPDSGGAEPASASGSPGASGASGARAAKRSPVGGKTGTAVAP